MTKEQAKQIVKGIIYQFISDYDGDGEIELTKEDRLLLEVNKTICNAIDSLEELSSDDCVSREQLKREPHAQMAVNAITKETAEDMLNHLPPVTPTHGICKDCFYYNIDEDGNGYHCEKYGHTRFPVYADFYCKDFEKRGGENASS